jgi:hypothetical protein
MQKYLESIKLELSHNKEVLHAADSLYTTRLPVEDSIVKIFLAKKENEVLDVMAHLVATSRGQYTPPIEISAYNQLVNSGGLKYIDNALKDSLSKYESLIESLKTYNTGVNNYMVSAFPGITSIEDLSDYVHEDGNHLFVMSPYPELSERERRQIINYYTFHYVRTYNDRKNVRLLINNEDHLISMVQQEIN